MSDTFLWIIVVALLIFIAYSMCSKNSNTTIEDIKKRLMVAFVEGRILGADGKTDTPEGIKEEKTADVKPDVEQSEDRELTEVKHVGFLSTLFSREVETLPDGVDQEGFDKMVREYQDRNLKVEKQSIPRSSNFNYEEQQAEKDKMDRSLVQHYAKHRDRDDIGQVTNQYNRQLASGIISASTFMKKTSKK